MMYYTQLFRRFGVLPNVTKMSILARKQDKNPLLASLVVEQPKPLSDNDYMLPTVISENAVIVS